MTFLSNLPVTKILYSFKLVVEGKTGKGITESSRLDFLDKFSQTVLLYQIHNVTPPGC